MDEGTTIRKVQNMTEEDMRIHGVEEKETAVDHGEMIVANTGSANENANESATENDMTLVETGNGIGTGEAGPLRAPHRDVQHLHILVHTLNDLARPLSLDLDPRRLSTKQNQILRRRVFLLRRPTL
jgi:hypothetical protein